MQMTTKNEAGNKVGQKAGKKVRKTPAKKVKKAGDMPRDPAVSSGPDTGPDTGLIVWSADREASDPLIQALKTARALDLSEALPDPEDVQTGAQAPQILLLCAAPLGSMCRQMAQGTPPKAALAAWVAEAGAVLAVNRRNRRKVHILDISQTLRNPGPCLAGFGVATEVAEAAQATEAAETRTLDDTSEAPDQVLLLLAQRCLHGDAQARALAGELEAAMATRVATITDDPDAAFRSYREACWTREESGLLRTQMSLMLEEMDLVQEQNRAAQQEMQGLSENAVLTQQRLAQLNQGIASYQAQLEESRATKAELHEKLAVQEIAIRDTDNARHDLLREKLAAQDIAIRDTDNARRELEARTAELNATHERAEGLQAWVHQLETSHSYRLTAPLRRVRALISRVRGGG